MLLHSDKWGNDTRSLCTGILQSTIKDTDKYQVGLTKIFFRAGLLASFEQYRSARLNSLAVLIQKNFQRHMAVKRFKDLKAAAVGIQTAWRSVLAKRLVDGMRREAAAILLQRVVRGYLERERYKRATKCIIGLQSSKLNFLCYLIGTRRLSIW